MAYDYYRGYQPQMWGTAQYQLPHAPIVPYVPQANWNGMDYYHAHTRWGENDEDDGLFERIRSSVRRFMGTGGMPAEEARIWHQRVYAGLVDMRTAASEIIGAAAGYEALRFWETNQSLRVPVLNDYEREEDAIMGLAVAESEKLWGYTGRLRSERGRREAAEAAAATVHRIYRRNHRGHYYGESRRRHHREAYDDIDYDEGYGYGDHALTRRRSFASGSRYYDSDDDYYGGDEYSSRSRRRRASVAALTGPPLAPVYSAPTPYVAQQPYGVGVGVLPQPSVYGMPPQQPYPYGAGSYQGAASYYPRYM